LADRVASRLRAKRRAGHTVTVRIRFPDLKAITRSTTLDAPISSTPILARIAEDLVRTGLADSGADQISLLAISVSSLVYEEALQLELPFHLDGEELRPGTEEGAARWAADRSVDAIRERFGREAVGYASGFDRLGSVPDEFRELAEKG
ncbi:MAG: DNA polymerase IV, partial [Acidimicrobiia bacterium]